MRASGAQQGARPKPLRQDARVYLPPHRTAQERRHARALPTPMTLLGHFYASPVTLFFGLFFRRRTRMQCAVTLVTLMTLILEEL